VQACRIGLGADKSEQPVLAVTGEVLVGLGLGAVEPVEPAEHGPVAQDLAVQLADRRPPSWRNVRFCSSMSSGEFTLAWLVA